MNAPTTLPPSSLPDAALVDAGAERLQHHRDALAALVAQYHATLGDAVEQSVRAPLTAALTAAADAHRALAEAAGFFAEGDAPGAEAAWQRLCVYREGARADVLAPLHDRLERLGVGHTLTSLWMQVAADLAAEASAFPAVVVRAEPGALYGAGAGSFVARTRKAMVRFGRGRRALTRSLGNAARRVVGKEAVPPPVPVQQVPVQQLAHYHFAVRQPAALAPHYDALQQRFAAPMARLEAELTDWTHQVLAAERALDAPGHHVETLPAPDAPPPGTAATDAYAGVAGRARALDTFLRALAETIDLAPWRAATREAVTTALDALDHDLDHADSFQLDLAAREAPADGPVQQRIEVAGVAWGAWHAQLTDRLGLQATLLALRDRIVALQEAQVDAILDAGFYPVLSLIETAEANFRRWHGEADEAFAAARSDDDPAALRARLDALSVDATAYLDDLLRHRLDDDGPAAALWTAAEEGAGQLLALLGDLPPAFILHPLPDRAAEAVTPQDDTRTVALRELAEQVMDALLVERLRLAAEPAAAALDRARREVEQVLAMVQFNLDAARDELLREGAGGLEAASEFARNGFGRAEASLNALREALATTPPAVATVVFSALDRGWGRLHERVRLEGRMQEQFVDLQTQLLRRSQDLLRQAQTGLQRGTAAAGRVLQQGRQRARVLIRLGQSAVGTAQLETASLHQTLDAVAGVGPLTEQFPLVYRRLFTFEPLTDAALLENRDADLEAVRRHYERWRNGLSGALIVTGAYGNGHTTFLNVLRQRVLKDAHCLTLSLHERLEAEADIAQRLAHLFDFDAQGDAPWTLDALAQRLQERTDARPLVCMVEHLEHLWLRHVSGTRLIEQVLSFFSRTDGQVLWIATAAEHGWRYLARTRNVAASLVSVHVLAAFDRDALTRLILNRHHRSGLPLTFEEPVDLNPLLRRRLRRARTREERQRLLQDDFFDRLFRATGESIRLALFYWLRAAALDAEAAVVRIHPLRPLSFAFLSAYPLSQAFALHAFLQHGTLTLDEHARIFQSSTDESLQIFESLLNYLIIEPAGPLAGRVNGQPIVAGQRYRIRPLIIQPVLQHLSGRHIVY